MIISRHENPSIVGNVHGLDGDTTVGGGGRGAGMWYHVADAFGTAEIEYLD